MEKIQVEIDGEGFGHLYMLNDGERLGEMEVKRSGSGLTVYHTEVSPKAEGKGFAKKMLVGLVAYAREHRLKVIPLCPFVHAQFKRHPEAYADVWNQAGS